MDFDQLTLGKALRNTAARLGDKIALVDRNEKVTYEQLDDEVDDIASGLLACGVQHGDSVALWMANTSNWIRVWLATARIGAVLVPINTRYKAEEAAFILRQSESKVLIMMDNMWSIDYIGLLSKICPDLKVVDKGKVTTKYLPALTTVIVDSNNNSHEFFSLKSLLLEGSGDKGYLRKIETQVNVNDPVIIVYTSGTTGKPKGAVHSHISLKNGYNIARTLHVTESDVILGHMPFYHVAGAFSALLPSIGLGCTLVLLSHWDADVALELIEKERISYISGIPTHFIDLVESMRKCPADTSSLRTAWIGGAAVTPEVVESVLSELKLPSIQAVYGMTETTSSTTLSGYDAPLEIIYQNKGKPIGDFEVKIFNPVTGIEVPVGNVGEIWVRGHIVMLGYYKNPVATKEVMTDDGWFKTGDLGVFDKQGYLQITGRAKEMFIVGGSNTYPAEIEQILQSNSSIKLAVVVGVPDDRLGEVGHAFVQLNKGCSICEKEILDYCKEHMADYKVPRYISIVAEFPKTTTGKLQRSVLKERALSEFQ